MDNVSACLLLPEDDETRIYNRSHFQTLLGTWTHFCLFEDSALVVIHTPQQNRQKMVCSMRMDFEEDPKTLLNEAIVDLAKVESLMVHYKNTQA